MPPRTHMVVDCGPRDPADTSPRETRVQLTAQEVVDYDARNAAWLADQQAAQAQAATLRAAALANPDPLIQALAKRAGILP